MLQKLQIDFSLQSDLTGPLVTPILFFHVHGNGEMYVLGHGPVAALIWTWIVSSSGIYYGNQFIWMVVGLWRCPTIAYSREELNLSPVIIITLRSNQLAWQNVWKYGTLVKLLR